MLCLCEKYVHVRERKKRLCAHECVCGWLCNGVVVICMRVYVNVCVREREWGVKSVRM